MQLLISVRNPSEAADAIGGGAHIIDAKEPDAGALGAVDLGVFCGIVSTVANRRPVSAALGDAGDDASIARDVSAFIRAGAAFVKLGFAGNADSARIERLLVSAVRAGGGTIVAVAYADAECASAISPLRLIDVGARAGVQGVLLDTARKDGPGVCEWMGGSALSEWVRRAHDAGLFAAVAGSLTADQLPRVRDVGADIAGVRGAACVGGRSGVITRDGVRRLRERVDDASFHAGAREASPPVPVSS
jgi:uncharacterized protein (UPF0264 family)